MALGLHLNLRDCVKSSLNTCIGTLTNMTLHLVDQGGIRYAFGFVMNFNDDVLFWI